MNNMLILFLVVQNVVESIVTQDGYDKSSIERFLEHRNKNSKENPALTQKSVERPQNFLELERAFKEFQSAYKKKGTF